MKRLIAAVAAAGLVLLTGCGGEEESSAPAMTSAVTQTTAVTTASESASAVVSEEKPPSYPVFLEEGGFDLQRHYSSDTIELTELSELSCDITDITIILDPTQLGFGEGSLIELAGAHDGYAYFSLCDKERLIGAVLEADCATGAVTEVMRAVAVDDFTVHYADSDCCFFTLNGECFAHVYANDIYEDGKRVVLPWDFHESGNFCRLNKNVYYDTADGKVVYMNAVGGGVYEDKNMSGGIYIDSGDTEDLPSGEVFDYTVGGVCCEEGDITVRYYGLFNCFVQKTSERNLFGNRYALGYNKFGTNSGSSLLISDYGVEPYDVHISFSKLMAFHTDSVYTPNVSPVVIDIDERKAAAADGFSDKCVIMSDVYGVYLVEKQSVEYERYRIMWISSM